MKKILILISFFISGIILAQTDKNISVSKSTEVDQNKMVVEYIQKESNGGKLDFQKALEKEKAPFIRYGDILYNKKDFAILLWGKAVNIVGINTLEETISIWEEINKRKLSEAEVKAIKIGFESDK